MAPSAVDGRLRAVPQALIRLLAPRPGRSEHAARLALICALTVLVAEIYQTPEPALAIYIVFFLNEEDRATSLILNVVLLLLITVIIGLIFLVAMIVLDDPMWRVISMTVISFCFLFLTSASKLRPLGATIALIIGYGLDELGLIQIGELGTRALLYAWLFVGIPAGVSMIVNLLIAPPPRRLAERAIVLRLKLCAAMLRAAGARTRREFEECVREGMGEIQKWLALAEKEKTSRAADILALRQAANSTTVLLSAIDVMDRNHAALLPDSLRGWLARTIDEMAAIVSAGGYPTEVAWQPPDDGWALTPLATELLADIEDAIVRFAERPAVGVRAAQPAEKEKAGGFLEPDAFTNPVHVQYALRTTAAAMFCYALYSLLDWPGIHTCFITCYIVSLTTTAESIEKLTLRIFGAIVGAAIGTGALVFIMPSLSSIGGLMIVVFLGAWVAAYVIGGGPRIAYAGFQMAFAFFLCVVQGASPAFDMTTARDRVIGILIGNLVAYLLFANLRPVSVGSRIDPAIASLLRGLSAMMTDADTVTRRAAAGQSRSALAAITADIELAGYEPDGIRPAPAWLAARREAVSDIGGLEGPLLLAADQYATASAHIAARLQSLAGRFAASEADASEADKTSGKDWSALPLLHIIDTGLGRLEEGSTHRAAHRTDG
jgi:multidrug resistance protein MdtO